jgi:hypothetical protein
MGDRHAGSGLQGCQRVGTTRHVEHQDDAAGGTLVGRKSRCPAPPLLAVEWL